MLKGEMIRGADVEKKRLGGRGVVVGGNEKPDGGERSLGVGAVEGIEIGTAVLSVWSREEERAVFDEVDGQV